MPRVISRAVKSSAIFLVAFLSLLPACRPLKVNEFAVPQAVSASQDAELRCRYDLAAEEQERAVVVKWFWTPLNASMHQLYQRIGSRRVQVLRNNIRVEPNDTIVLLDVQPEDSGVYECEVSVSISEERSQGKMVVFSEGSGPQVNATTVADGDDADDDDDVLITCEASDVAPEPELAITVGTEQVKVFQWVSAPAEGRYNVSANATVSASAAADAEIRCELFFTDDTISHPAYVDSFTYEVTGEATPTVEGATDEPAPEDTESPPLPDDASSREQSPAVMALLILIMFWNLRDVRNN